jgi:hypothetical protein
MNLSTLRTSLLSIKYLCLLIIVSLLLAGCMDYQVGVNFNHANSGELVQHVKLGERLTTFAGEPVYEWLNSIEQRAQQLKGKVQRISKDEVIVTIPFTNSQELQQKFNAFFHSHSQQKTEVTAANSASQLPQIASNFLLKQSNFFLLVRNHLIYDLDLRSLGLISNQGNVLANAGSILNLEFSLKTPWKAKIIPVTENTVPAKTNKNQIIWKLNPGQINHIEAVFWLPSPLGIGTLLIVLFVGSGFYLRYKFMPDPRIQFASQDN